jgi:hypothetical protein
MNKSQHTRIRTLIMALVCIALLATAFVSTQGPARANSSNLYRYPYNQAGGVTYNVNDVTQTWNSWKSTVITANNAGGGGRLRVMGGVDNQSTVSEGQGYGILFASIFDDQTTLDGLWLFTKDYLNSQGLMERSPATQRPARLRVRLSKHTTSC